MDRRDKYIQTESRGVGTGVPGGRNGEQLLMAVELEMVKKF